MFQKLLDSEHNALSEMARLWGWSELAKLQHIINDDDAPVKLRGEAIIWYESGDIKKVVLQINRMPIYHVSVQAIHYRICSGWYCFDLFKSKRKMQSEVERLYPFVGREWFMTQEKRRQFRKAHPECANYSWKKIQERGTPYSIHSVQS